MISISDSSSSIASCNLFFVPPFSIVFNLECIMTQSPNYLILSIHQDQHTALLQLLLKEKILQIQSSEKDQVAAELQSFILVYSEMDKRLLLYSSEGSSVALFGSAIVPPDPSKLSELFYFRVIL
jgi:hypothetical protein